MNRFGIRMAAGLAVACLSGLAIYQVKSGSESVAEDDWPLASSVAAAEPPAPLGLAATSGSFENTAGNLENTGDPIESGFFPAETQGGLRRVSYDAPLPTEGESQPSMDPAAGPSSGFGLPPTLDSRSMEPNVADYPAADPARPTTGPALEMPLLEPQFTEPASTPAEQEEPDYNAAAAPGGFALPNAPEWPQPNTTSLLAPLPTTLAPAETSAEADPANVNPLRSSVVVTPIVSGVAETNPAASGHIPAANLPALAPVEQEMESHAAQWGQHGLQPVGAEDVAAVGVPELVPTEGSPELRVASRNNVGNMGNLATNSHSLVQNGNSLVQPDEVLSVPGERSLEGDQAPSVVIQKLAPSEVRVGKACDFVIKVRNVGTVPALDVRVFDSVPDGTSLMETVPSAEQAAGLMIWQLGDLKPGDERSITMRLIPEVEGEIGSVARVTFEAAASVRTLATLPAIKLVQRAPEEVLIGQQLEIEIELSNTGSGAAEQVVLKAVLPEGLEHPMGSELDNPIGTMPPGDLRRQLLRVRATKPGIVKSVVSLVNADGTLSESSVDIKVIAPNLQVVLAGPAMRYLERQATYSVQIANTGTANASEIDLVAFLDSGLKFVSTDFEGKYDPNRHAVTWSLAELPAGESGQVPLTLLPVESGTQSVRLEATADLGISVSSEKQLAIETLAELSFSIADNNDPIEAGTETMYEIRVQNSGSREDSNVRLEVQLPHPGMKLVSAEPSAATDGRGRVVFEPLARLAAKGEYVFRVVVSGVTPDTHLIKATLMSDQSKKPVTKEESTTVYADQ